MTTSEAFQRLFAKLRDEGFLIKRKGTDYNTPTQTSFLPNQQNTSIYFCVEETERYFEEKFGRETTEKMKEYHKVLGRIINAAYDDGYQDGIAAAHKTQPSFFSKEM